MRKLLILLPLIAACSAPERTHETLEKAGFEDIRVKGWRPLTCGEDDTFSTGFVARNGKGILVEGVVCCGLIAKQCTIRF